MLRSTPIGAIPPETLRVAGAAFPKGNLYLRMRDELGVLFEDADFADLFPHKGRPALPPWRLALVTVFQFLEGLSDRQAADAVRARLDWKYALGLELTDPGFDFSVLAEFRARLLSGQLGEVLLNKLLAHFRERGLLNLRGRQRTDSTHVLAAVRRLSRLEIVIESLRAALNAIAVMDAAWLQTRLRSGWVERYARIADMERLPKGEQPLERYAVQVGEDGQALLLLVSTEGSAQLQSLSQVQFLKAVWKQQFEVEPDSKAVRWKPKAEQSSSSERPCSPYDPDARFAANHSKNWVGYKVHLSETCEATLPELITHVHLTPAPTNDVQAVNSIHEGLRSKGLIPTEHLMDGGYISADLLAAHQGGDIQIVGPARRPTNWQRRSENAFTHDDFQIDWDRRDVTCPQGFLNSAWTEKAYRGRTTITVKFRYQTCGRCPVRQRCTKSDTLKRGRTLQLRAEDRFRALSSARNRQTEEEWLKLYQLRAGVEATMSQAVRRFDLRRARYWGMNKVRFQMLCTAAAINLVRYDAWLQAIPRGTTRVPILKRLSLSA